MSRSFKTGLNIPTLLWFLWSVCICVTGLSTLCLFSCRWQCWRPHPTDTSAVKWHFLLSLSDSLHMNPTRPLSRPPHRLDEKRVSVVPCSPQAASGTSPDELLCECWRRVCGGRWQQQFSCQKPQPTRFGKVVKSRVAKTWRICAWQLALDS